MGCGESLVAGLDEPHGCTKDATKEKAEVLEKHFESSPNCLPNPRALAFLTADMAGNFPWRAISDKSWNIEILKNFRRYCSKITSFNQVAAAMYSLVQSVEPGATHPECVPVLESMVRDLSVIEGVFSPANVAAKTRSDKSSTVLAVHRSGVSTTAAAGEVENHGTGGDGRLVMTKAEFREQRERKAASLAVLIIRTVDQHLLNWHELGTMSLMWESSESGGFVKCEVPEQSMGFRYTKHCVMSLLGDAQHQQAAAKFSQARKHWTPPVDCPACSGSGRNLRPSYQNEVCSNCVGFGITSGDSIFKKQLKDGCPFKLLVKHISSDKGWGVIALEAIKAGQAVSEYVGEVVTARVARSREPLYQKNKQYYLFEQLLPSSTMSWVTDATYQVILDEPTPL